jgi:hypothetical protein
MAGIDPVERLLAIEEIKQLKARYFRFIERIRTNVLLVGASSTVGMSSTPREA